MDRIRVLFARVSRRSLRLVLLVLVPVCAVLFGAYLYARGGRFMETDNAYVKAHIVAMSAEVSGRVAEVRVRDNQPVAAGALLFRLDSGPFEIAVARARAQMDVVRTEVRSLRAEYRAALSEADEAKQRIRFLERQLERQARLKEYGMIRADVYDEARLDLEVARRRFASIQERANRVLANLAGNPELPEEQHPRFAEAKTALDSAMLDLGRTRVTASHAGVVSNMKLQVGEHVEKGSPVFSLIEHGPIWIEANFKETQLTHMREGQVVHVAADAFPDHSWSGVVSAIAPATGAEFAVLPPQNAMGNWVKVVQRIPVLIQVEQKNSQPPLRAGMTVSVSVDTGHERGLPSSVRRLVDAGYLPDFLQPADALARDRQ